VTLLGLVVPLRASVRRDRRRWLLLVAPLPRSSRFHRDRAERAAATLARMGPTFIKLTQLFAGRRDLIPSPYVEALGTLTDRVPSVPWARIRDELTRSYGSPHER